MSKIVEGAANAARNVEYQKRSSSPMLACGGNILTELLAMPVTCRRMFAQLT